VAVAGRIKGSGIGEFVAWYLTTVDGSRLRKATAALPPEHAALIDPAHERLGLLASRWYPDALIHRLLDVMLAGMSKPEIDDLVQRAAVATVEGMRRGVYKILFSWFLTPERYGKLVQAAWERNYETGRVESTVIGVRRHKGVVVGWESHHWFLCRLNVAVKAEIYRAIGCKGVVIEQRYCRDDGDDACGSIIGWSA
jgi:hypothetical protein